MNYWVEQVGQKVTVRYGGKTYEKIFQSPADAYNAKELIASSLHGLKTLVDDEIKKRTDDELLG